MNGKRVGILSLLALVLAASVLIAAAGDAKERQKTIVIGDNDETISISMTDGSILRIVSDDGEEEVVEIDLSMIGQIVEEAMVGVDEALAGLADLDLDLELDELDHISVCDGEDVIQFDIAALFEQVGEALEDAFDTSYEAWDDVYEEREDRDAYRERHRVDSVDLQSELEELREQVAELRKELQQLRQRQRR